MANFALNYSFSRNLSIPIDEDAVKATRAEVITYAQTKSKCYEGQLFSVTGDTEENNGLYIALTKGTNANVIKIGSESNPTSISAMTYTEGKALATDDNIGQIVNVLSAETPEGAASAYTSGLYIVTGNNAISKLGVTSATGNIEGQVQDLETRVSKIEATGLYWLTDEDLDIEEPTSEATIVE